MNTRFINCETCQTEGRILTCDGGPDEIDHGVCPACNGERVVEIGDERKESPMTKEERDLLLMVARIVLAHHNSSGPDASRQREALRKAMAPFEAELEEKN